MEGIRLSVDTCTTSTTGTTTSDSSSDEEGSTENNIMKRKNNESFDSYADQPKIPRIDPTYSDNYYNKESDDNEQAPQSSEILHDFSYNSHYKSDEDSENGSERMSFSSFNQQSHSNPINHFESNQSDYKDNHQSDSSETNLSDAKDRKIKNAQSDIVMRMMMKQGYVEGRGLGKNLQGRLEPVQESKQKGHRGLGLEMKEFEKVCLDFKPEEEKFKVEESL